jgi:hypothetical protein
MNFVFTFALILTFFPTPTSDVGAGKDHQAYVFNYEDACPANPVV